MNEMIELKFSKKEYVELEKITSAAHAIVIYLFI